MTTHLRKNMARIVPVAATVALLAACATGPTVRSNYDPGADFGRYRTYGYVENLGTDRSGYSTIVSSILRTAVSRELERRGYSPSPAPDLLVNFQARLRRVQDVSPGPGPGPFYYGYRDGVYGPWPGYDYELTVRDYTEGTLNIDIVDRDRKQLVWEGVAIGEVSERKLRDPATSLPEVVARILAHYPFAAGQGAAVPRP